MQKVLLIGSSGGVGSACSQLLLSKGYNVTGWHSTELDLNFPDRIFEKNFSSYDILINCAAHNQGTYQGFLKNTNENQLSQIMVNYVSNLFLLKHYANSRTNGKYVWCGTDLTAGVTPFKSVYLSTKVGSQFAIELIKQEATHISVLEAEFGQVRSNLRYRNFEGTLTAEEIERSYGNSTALSSEYVAENIISAIEQNLEKVIIK